MTGYHWSLASPDMGHWGTCPLDFQLLFFWSLQSRTHSDIGLYKLRLSTQ